jgi:hypothetical protein
MKNHIGCVIGLFIGIVFAVLVAMPMDAYAEDTTDIRIVVDGKDITYLASPVVRNDRVMVPVRFVTSELGAEIIWDGEERTVTATKGDRQIFLRIDSYLVSYDNGSRYQISDVAPFILLENERTYVPLRLISNGFGVGIEWLESTRTVEVQSDKHSESESFHDIIIVTEIADGLVSGKTDVELTIGSYLKERADRTQLLLVDPDTASGFVVASEKGAANRLSYMPSFDESGEKLLVAAIFDDQGRLIGGDVRPITVTIKPKVEIEGIQEFSIYNGSINIEPKLNFVPKYVAYEFTRLENNRKTIIDEQDPFASYTWTPNKEQEGNYRVRLLAYDNQGNAYESASYNATILVERKLSLRGVTENMTIRHPVNLLASRNFDVTETQFIVKDAVTGAENVLATIPYGSFSWFPGKEDSGDKLIKVRVKDIYGTTHDSVYVPVKVDGSPTIRLAGVGPNQVLTGNAQLSVTSNAQVKNVRFILTNRVTGQEFTIGETVDSEGTLTFEPKQIYGKQVSLRAEAMYEGKRLTTEDIGFNIYLGELYGAKPIIEKDAFLPFASNLAKKSHQETGMSAALQTAQAILETGWGQSVPVDKYSGKFSNNLFGIKGSASNGSVISNTWEVYNGISYRVDDRFRAYHTVQESWDDHKALLLNAARYQPFREVMYHSSLGAWAIRRAGYATDPQYPLKLMRLIEQYDLKELDRIEI